jgi:hypothetical protein
LEFLTNLRRNEDEIGQQPGRPTIAVDERVELRSSMAICAGAIPMFSSRRRKTPAQIQTSP